MVVDLVDKHLNATLFKNNQDIDIDVNPLSVNLSGHLFYHHQALLSLDFFNRLVLSLLISSTDSALHHRSPQ